MWAEFVRVMVNTPIAWPLLEQGMRELEWLLLFVEEECVCDYCWAEYKNIFHSEIDG